MFLSHIDVSVCLPLPLPLNSVNIAQLIIFFLIHRTVRQRGCVPVGRHVQAMGSFGTRGVHTVCRSLCKTVHRMWECALTPHPAGDLGPVCVCGEESLLLSPSTDIYSPRTI